MATVGSEPSQTDTELLQAVLDAYAGASPFTGTNPADAINTVRQLLRLSMSQPAAMARFVADLSVEMTRIGIGVSDIDLSADRRFSHDQYLNNPILQRVGQSYLAWSRAVRRFIDDLDLDEATRNQAHFATAMITEALAPTNTLAGNPAAVQEAIDTRGQSLAAGFNNWLRDQFENDGMPSMVDTSSFVKGETIAATEGAVVLQTEVFELIRYAPRTDKVHTIPVLMIPPQINKYYILDMAPDRSLIQNTVEAGQQVFVMSWRNPTAEMRDWDLNTYVEAVMEAATAAQDLTKSSEINLLGVCAGGITMAAALGYLAAVGDKRVNSCTFLVAMLEWSRPSTISSMISGQNSAAVIQHSQQAGILSGDDLSKLFAWMRPNDLVWNYWTNNYLMGRQPAAFDILAWNVDSTNLPAALHADFVTMAAANSMTRANEVQVLDRKIDLGDVDCDGYVVGGLTDHITDWKSCYRTATLLGGRNEFVLAKSGHVQTLVSPLDNPKSRYLTGTALPDSPDSWLEQADEHNGSWISHWLGWLGERSGERKPAPKRLHSKDYPSLGDAPGSYVHG